MRNRISITEEAMAVEEQVAQIFTLTWQRKETRPAKEHPHEKTRELRGGQYASIQRLMNISRKDAANAMLNGSWREASH